MLACQLIVDICDDIFLLRKEISFDVLKKHFGLFLLYVLGDLARLIYLLLPSHKDGTAW